MSHGRSWTMDEVTTIRRMAAAGRSDGEIAMALGRHPKVVGRKRRDHGIACGVTPVLSGRLGRLVALDRARRAAQATRDRTRAATSHARDSGAPEDGEHPLREKARGVAHAADVADAAIPGVARGRPEGTRVATHGHQDRERAPHDRQAMRDTAPVANGFARAGAGMAAQEARDGGF